MFGRALVGPGGLVTFGDERLKFEAAAGGGSPAGTYWISDNTSSPEVPNYAMGVGDTLMDSGNPTVNHGNDSTFDVQNTVYNGLIKFSGLSNLTGPVTVTSSSIFIFCTVAFNDGTATINAYRCLRDWVETQATWNVYSTGNNWGTGGAENTSTDRSSTVSAAITTADTETNTWHEFTSAQLATDIENIINGTASNFGWVVKQTQNGDSTFASRTGTDGNRPRLKVVIA